MRLNTLLAILIWLPFTLSAHSDLHSNHDALETRFIKSPKTLNNSYQEFLRNQDSWKQFLAANPEWWVQFNESTGRPHRAMGKPIAIPVSGSPEQAAAYFLNNVASMFLPANTDLRFTGSTSTEKYLQPNFTQYYLGKEILWSRATVKMTTDYKAVLFGMDVYSDIQLPEQPAIDEQTAVNYAVAGVSDIEKITVAPDQKILPIARGRRNRFHLVYEVTVSTRAESGIPAVYYTLVDAHSGKILYRQNRVNHFAANTDVTINGTVYPTHVYNPTQVVPLPYVKMDMGGVIYNADVNGLYSNFVLSSAVPATFYLEGPWAKIYTGASGNTVSSFASNINVGTNSVSFDPGASIRHLSAYYHTNVVHDFMKSKLTTFTSMDNPMIVRVDRTDGNCNAFYDGNLNFYTTSNGCHALSQVADVIYHEYGHGITHEYWGANGLPFSNGAMGEGYADVWAISITNNPVLGVGFDSGDPTVFIRNYDFNNGVSRKVYPQNIVGEVHADGEIIAGAWYSTALLIGSLSTMSDIFSASHAGLANGPDGAEGQVYTDILIDALLADDNDADITNGTPNGISITTGFAQHGITLLSNASVLHTPVTAIASNTSITLDATLNASTFFWSFSEIRGFYQINGSGAWTPFSMSNTGGSNYSTTIPGQPAGTIIGYYFGLEDIYGHYSNIQPKAADLTVNPNIPHFIKVGYNLLFTDDFDFNAGFWITGLPGDNATTGMWEQNEPYTTSQGGITVQPNYQNTIGGQYCYITASTPGAALGDNDVDGGKTSIQSPDIDMSDMNNPAIEYFRWYSNDQGATPGTDFWQVSISNDGVNYVQVEHTPTADHSWRRFVFRVADYVQPSATVSVRFVAEDANAGSLVEALMDDFSVYETATTGIQENADILTASLAPNPANDRLQLQCAMAKAGSFILTVTEATGRVVYKNNTNFTAGINLFSVPVSELSNGVYLLNLNGENGTKSIRFIVAH